MQNAKEEEIEIESTWERKGKEVVHLIEGIWSDCNVCAIKVGLEILEHIKVIKLQLGMRIVTI